MNWSMCYVCDAVLTGNVYRLRDHSFCWSCRQDEDSSDSDDGEFFIHRKWKNKDSSTSSSWKAIAGMWDGLLTFRRALLAIFSEQGQSGPSSIDPSLYIASDQVAPC